MACGTRLRTSRDPSPGSSFSAPYHGRPTRPCSRPAPQAGPAADGQRLGQIMRLRVAILIACLIPLGLWLWVLASAWSFFAWASNYFADTGSINAANDLGYSQVLLVASGIGSTAALACAVWLACKRSVQAVAAETWATGFGVAFFAGDHAHPIHLFPTGGSLLLAFAATGVLLATALVATHLVVRGRLPNKAMQPTGAPSGAGG